MMPQVTIEEGVFFLRPAEPKTRQKVLRNIIKILDTPEEVCLCVSYFSYKKIADILVERFHKNRKTRIILNAHDILRPEGLESTEIRMSAALVTLFQKTGGANIRLLGRDTDSRGHHKMTIMHHNIPL